MNTELKNAVQAADKKAQYDESAKRLLGQKSILAHILVKCVEEFKGMDPKDIVPLIEGTPYIGCVPVEPGLTNIDKKNSKKQRIIGINTKLIMKAILIEIRSAASDRDLQSQKGSDILLHWFWH